VAVRPERLKLGPAAADGDGLPGTLVDIVYLGNARRSVVRLADGRDCFVFQHATQADASRLAPGQALRLSWESHHATVFPDDDTTA
jgi:putative spermidine/putrescine transport system ATP-binding protein